MTLVDERGRLFGRWNVVDALVGVVLLGLIPLLYAGYLLFRSPAVSLNSVEPNRIQAPGAVDVTIHGTNLRPYMRISFDAHQARGFFFSDTSKAVVGAPEMPPGVYDVILYDNAQERARIPKGFEVIASPRPQTQLDVVGSFTAVAAALSAQIKPGVQIAGLGEVTQVGKPQPSMTRTVVGPLELVDVPSASAHNIPAVIRASCTLVLRAGAATCTALDATLTRDAMLTIPLGGANALFQVDQVRPAVAATPIEVRARLSGERAVIERVRRGDRDRVRANEFVTGAEIVSTSGVSRAASSVIVSAQLSAGSPPTIVAGDLATVEVVLRLPGHPMPDGWSYHGHPLRVGGTFIFHGPDYEASTTVLGMTAK